MIVLDPGGDNLLELLLLIDASVFSVWQLLLGQLVDGCMTKRAAHVHNRGLSLVSHCRNSTASMDHVLGLGLIGPAYLAADIADLVAWSPLAHVFA